MVFAVRGHSPSPGQWPFPRQTETLPSLGWQNSLQQHTFYVSVLQWFNSYAYCYASTAHAAPEELCFAVFCFVSSYSKRRKRFMFNYVYLNILQQCLLCLIVMRPFPKKSHCALHPVCLSVPPSLRFSLPCPPLTRKRKAVQCSNLAVRLSTSGVTGRTILRLISQRPMSLGTEIWKLFSPHIFAKNVSIHEKLRPKWPPFHAARFVYYNAEATMCTLRDNWTTMFDCADVLFQVNGTSARCCAAVKQTWRAAYRVPILQQPLFVIDCKQLYKIWMRSKLRGCKKHVCEVNTELM